MLAVSSSRSPQMGEPHLLARRTRQSHAHYLSDTPFPELSTAGRRPLRRAFGPSLLPSD